MSATTKTLFELLEQAQPQKPFAGLVLPSVLAAGEYFTPANAPKYLAQAHVALAMALYSPHYGELLSPEDSQALRAIAARLSQAVTARINTKNPTLARIMTNLANEGVI